MEKSRVGQIFCLCSAHMRDKGEIIDVDRNGPYKVECPKCGQMRKVYIYQETIINRTLV